MTDEHQDDKKDETPTESHSEPPKEEHKEEPKAETHHESNSQPSDAVVNAIGELKDMLKSFIEAAPNPTDDHEDQQPTKKPWFARGGRS